MSDLIRREDVYAAIRSLAFNYDRIAAIRAIPAVSAKHDFAQPEPRPKPFDCQCGAVGPCEAPFCFAPIDKD